MQLAQVRLSWPPIDFAAPEPPADRPVAAVAWAFHQLARLAHVLVTQPALLSAAPAGWVASRVRGLVSVGFLPGNDQIKALIEAARGA